MLENAVALGSRNRQVKIHQGGSVVTDGYLPFSSCIQGVVIFVNKRCVVVTQ